jgi:hypothetical protein
METATHLRDLMNLFSLKELTRAVGLEKQWLLPSVRCVKDVTYLKSYVMIARLTNHTFIPMT